MKKIFTFLFSIFFLGTVGQELDLSDDITICSPSEVTISANITGSINLDLLTQVELTDDSHSGVINMGFDFDFYGNTFNSCVISSNNYITFDQTLANLGSGWAINNPIPGGGENNSIMAPWQDINPAIGGAIEYGTFGTAPNRVFVTRWYQVPMFSCTDSLFCSAVYLYEGSNKIETYIENKPLCDWNGGAAIHGLQNDNGTIAHVVIDPILGQPRNFPLQWTCENDAWEFVPDPTNPTNYNINQIPFQQILSPNGIVWADENGNQIGIGISVDVNPITTTTYIATAVECLSGSSLSGEVTVFVSDLNINPVITNPNCPGDSPGSIISNLTGGVAPFNIEWTADNSFTSSDIDIYNLDGGNYSLSVTDFYNCEVSAGPFNVNESPLDIQIIETIDPVSCFGFSDGTITTTTTGGTPAYTYVWSSTNTFTDNGASITDLAAGDYILNLTDNNGCNYSGAYTLTENSSLNISTNSSDYNGFNIRCYGGEDGWVSTTVSGGMLPYEFIWQNTIGDTVSNYKDLHNAQAGDYTLSISDAEDCPAVINMTLIQPDSLSIDVSDFQHKSCTYNNDGFIEIVSWGGPDTPPGSENFQTYTHRWDGPNFFYAYTEDIYNLEDGMYQLTTTDINDCVNTLSFEITEPPMVVAQYHVMDDTVTINHPYMNIYDISEGNIVAWEWDISNGFTSNAQDVLELNLATNLEDVGIKEYNLQLIATDEFGCTDTTYGIIAIKDEHTLFVPNAFTPDLDNNNDEFIVYHHGMQEDTYELKIYNRFGSLVHKSNDPNASWNGTNDFTGNPLMTGVYTYYITYKDFEGHIYDHITCENCTGTISLMR